MKIDIGSEIERLEYANEIHHSAADVETQLVAIQQMQHILNRIADKIEVFVGTLKG